MRPARSASLVAALAGALLPQATPQALPQATPHASAVAPVPRDDDHSEPPWVVADHDVLLGAADAEVSGAVIRVEDRAADQGFALRFEGQDHPQPVADPADFAELVFAAPAGRYTVWLRGRAPNPLGDSAWIQVDDERGTPRGARPQYGFGNWRDRASDTYVWSSHVPGLPPQAIDLRSDGEHRVRISARQPGFALDQIWLTRDAEARPGEGPARRCEDEERDFVSLFDGATLDGWEARGGKATYRVEDGAIVGSVGPGPNSFLCTAREYADFELRLEVRLDVPGNSGIQIRSHENEKGRVHGYQCEIDPSDRRWSGGLFEEGGRGWLQSLQGRAEAQAAFHVEGWNAYVIRAEGRRIRSWVNGVPCADYTDESDQATTSGFIGLQVHAGAAGQIRWRNLRIRELR